MELLYLILAVLGVFFFLAMPIMVFVAFDRIGSLRNRLYAVEQQLKHWKESPREKEGIARASVPSVEPPAAPTPPPPVTPPFLAAPTIAPKPAAEIVAEEIKVQRRPIYEQEFSSMPVVEKKPEPSQSFSASPLQAKAASVSQPIADEATKDPSAEIRLGARWATRLGIGFLVVAVVFFGIYISQHSLPIVRLAEVLLMASVITVLGRWLERQAREFGEAVFAGGLALFYFAAYAAHAIAAMRVVDTIGMGLLWQFLAVGAIASIAWWRDRAYIATMSVALGLLTCFFALHNDCLEITLVAALGLAAVAAFLRVVRGWVWPLAIGYVGAQICYLGALLVPMGFTVEKFFAGGWTVTPYPLAPELAPWAGITLVFPTAFFALLMMADTFAQIRGRKGSATLRTGTVIVAALAYGLGGWWGGTVVGAPWASHNLLAAAIVCLGAGLVYLRRRDLPDIYEILFASAGAWAAIYLMNEYVGWVRWLALILESFVFAWRVRRNGSGLAWVCLIAAWALSGFEALSDAVKLHQDVYAWDATRLKYAAWPLAAVALWAWLEKTPRKLKEEERTTLLIGEIFIAVGATVLGQLAWINPATSWIFLAVAAVAAIFAVLTQTRSAWPTVWLSVLFSMWLFKTTEQSTLGEIVFSLAAFTAAVLLVTYALQREAKATQKKTFAIIAEVIFFFSLLYVWLTGVDTPQIGQQNLPLIMTLAAIGLAALAWVGPWETTGDIAWVWAIVVLGFGFFNFYDSDGFHIHKIVSIAAVLILGWLWGVLARCEKPRVYVLRLEHAGMILPGLLFAGWTMLEMPADASLERKALLLAVCAVIFALTGRKEWLPGGGTAALILSFNAWLRMMLWKPQSMGDCLTPVLVSAAILFQGWLVARHFQNLNRSTRDVLLFLIAGAALLAIDWPAGSLPQPARQNLTLIWAGAGAAFFIIGLAARLRSYRYVGLLGLASCVPRMFITDITDPLGRIFAFGALAVVLLAIGFSYHKLRPWLVGRDEEPPAQS